MDCTQNNYENDNLIIYTAKIECLFVTYMYIYMCRYMCRYLDQYHLLHLARVFIKYLLFILTFCGAIPFYLAFLQYNADLEPIN